jgi:hypothetical protein
MPGQLTSASTKTSAVTLPPEQLSDSSKKHALGKNHFATVPLT